MPTPVILPKFGFTLETADIVKWLKHDGDAVRRGDPICEVTTDKVNMEVEATEDGTLVNLLYPEGATVPVTEIICYILRPGEARPAATIPVGPSTEAGNSKSVAPVEQFISPLARRIAEAANLDLGSVQGSGPGKRIMRRDVEYTLSANVEVANSPSISKPRATPAARRLAREAGLELSTLTGTGPRGRIQAADVAPLSPALSPTQAEGKGEMPEPTAYRASTGEDVYSPRVVKLEGMRRTIAQRLQQSYQTAPHFFAEMQIDMTGIESLRHEIKSRHEKLSVTSVLVKACAAVLLRHPWLNSTTDGEEVAMWPTANIGIAVTVENGLIVPVVHHAEKLSLSETQQQVDHLIERAHDNTLHINDMLDGTFTISNLGMYGVDSFTAILNPPQVAILAVGRTAQYFVPDANGQPVLRSLMKITLSSDHRVVDGVHAAKFLQDLRNVLEEPALLAW